MEYGFHVEYDPEWVPPDEDLDYTKAGPVTVTKADGTISEQDAYTREQYAIIVGVGVSRRKSPSYKAQAAAKDATGGSTHENP